MKRGQVVPGEGNAYQHYDQDNCDIHSKINSTIYLVHDDSGERVRRELNSRHRSWFQQPSVQPCWQIGIVGSGSQTEQQGISEFFVVAFVPTPLETTPRHPSRMPRIKNFRMSFRVSTKTIDLFLSEVGS